MADTLGSRPIGAMARMMRPANMVTAAADILAGFAVGFHFSEAIAYPFAALAGLIVSSLFLYAGGIFLNDVFDYELDQVERPERPLPRGTISLRLANYLGIAYLLAGISFASVGGCWSTLLAAGVALAAVSYDALAKASAFWGPVFMGLCRSGNLLLGASAFGSVWHLWPVAWVPLLFIGAVTLVSRGEVRGGGRRSLITAALIYVILIGALAGWAFQVNEAPWIPLLFVALFGLVVMPPLLRAIRDPRGQLIGNAVKWGVLGLIPMNAAWGCIFEGWLFGGVILMLFPISTGLARLFAVT